MPILLFDYLDPPLTNEQRGCPAESWLMTPTAVSTAENETSHSQKLQDNQRLPDVPIRVCKAIFLLCFIKKSNKNTKQI